MPLRALSERLGFTVGWDAATQQITLPKAERTVILWVGQTEASVDLTAPEADHGRDYLAG